MNKNFRGQRSGRPRRGGDPRRNRPGQGQGNQDRRPFRRTTSPTPSGPEALLRKYLVLLETHNLARKKYFEYFYRTDRSGRIKLEKQFNLTIQALRQFENKLTDQEKIILKDMLNLYPVDATYSQNHELPFEGEKDQLPQKVEDPHVLQTQKERPTFKGDVEESSGNLEDYKRYKGV